MNALKVVKRITYSLHLTTKSVNAFHKQPPASEKEAVESGLKNFDNKYLILIT